MQLRLKSPFTPDVYVETCESLSSSLASLAPSDHSDSPHFETHTLERINALTGVRLQSRVQFGCCCVSVFVFVFVSPHMISELKPLTVLNLSVIVSECYEVF